MFMATWQIEDRRQHVLIPGFSCTPHVLSRSTRYPLASLADMQRLAPLVSYAQGQGYFGDVWAQKNTRLGLGKD